MSRLIANRNKLKTATIIASKRTVEDALERASAIANAWMAENQNDPRLNQLQNVVDHLAEILTKSPQDMRADGVTSIEDYFDDAKKGDVARTIKREVDMIAKWQQEARPAEQPRTNEQQGVGYVPDNAVAQRGIRSSDKTADGAGFSTDRDEQGEPKAPTKLEVPRLAKKKKEAVPEDPIAEPMPEAAPAPAAAAPAPMPAPAPGANGKVNPIEYIPTETLLKVIGDMPKEDDFAQNKNKQDALIALTEILKQRPILPPEAPEGQAAAPAAPVAPAAPAADVIPPPVTASKRADYGDHAMGGDGSIGHAPGVKSAPVKSDPISTTRSTAPTPEPTSEFGLGGLEIASSLEEPKWAEDYRLHDYKLLDQDEGIVPMGGMPNMDEQEQRMHPEEHEACGMGGGAMMEGSMEKEAVTPPGISEKTMHELKEEYPGDKSKAYATAWSIHNKQNSLRTAVKVLASELEHWDKVASGAAGGGWSFDIGEKGKIVEDGGRTPEVAEAHGMLDESGADLNRPVTVAPIRLNKQAADMTTGKAMKQSETIGNDLKKMYLDAKSLTTVNDTRAVREAVEAIFRAADMFDEATKALNKQHQQEESEAEAQELKAKNKKSSFAGLALAAAE